jgi:hypothetical protein
MRLVLAVLLCAWSLPASTHAHQKSVSYSKWTLLDEGAIAQARADVPVQLIGAESRLFDCRIYGRSDPDVAANSRFSIDVEVLGSTVFARAIENPRYVNTERWTITETATPPRRLRTLAPSAVIAFPQ